MVMGEFTIDTDVLVVGGGPGGYAAAFRAADLGLDVTLVDTGQRPGGECLYRGCIPSKTLLFLAELIYDARRAAPMGIAFGEPKIDLAALRTWKGKVIDDLAAGLVSLTDRRGIQRFQGRAVFENSREIRIEGGEVSRINFKNAILATGSRPTPLPGTSFEAGSRIMNSAGALALPDIPKSLLIVGGGYVGLELGSVYAELGSEVTVVEMSDRLLTGVDPDLVTPLMRRLRKKFKAIHLNTAITGLTERERNVDVTLTGNTVPENMTVDRVLVAIGRQPASDGIGLETTEVTLDDQGFVQVDEQLRSSDKRIFAVGDVAGGLLLAHKASHEGKVAAEVIAGHPSAFEARAIPAVVYTDPQIAWCGLTEETARQQQREVSVQRFPWKFSGRAMTMDAADGLTKLIVDSETGRVLGVGVAGRAAEGIIAEGVLAVEMGALAQDLALSIHAHPTLSETEMEAAEIFLGTATHVMPRKLK